MEPLLALVCLLLGIALPIGSLYLLVRRGWRQLSAADAYREVSRRLGLSVDTRGVSVQGRLDGRRLWIGEVMVAYGPERRSEVRGVLGLDRPLGLALLLRRRGGRRFFRRRSPEQVTGDPEIDRRLSVNADDADAVRVLLGHDKVKTALRGLIERWPDVVVTDHAVRVHLPRPETSAASLERLVGAMARLADALQEARLAVPVPAALVEHVAPWERMADDLGLSFESHLPALSGPIDGLDVLVSVRREEQGYRAMVRVVLPEHRPLGLRLRPQFEPDGYWSIGQDIQVGDPAFDAAFVIKGWDPSRVRALLDDDVRARLLALTGTAANVEVDDHALVLRDAPLDADTLAPIVREAVEVGRRLRW